MQNGVYSFLKSHVGVARHGDAYAGLVNERKYTAHNLDVDRVLALIRHFCIPHPEYPEGQVNSIYFDTPGLATFKEKIEGDNQKRKYRLRWYDQCSHSPCDSDVDAFLEVKYRYGSAREKLRLHLKAPYEWLSCVPLEDPSLVAFLRRYASVSADNFPLDLIPSVCITYQRHRFVCCHTGLTVCVDCQIQVKRLNAKLFCSPVPFDLQTVVCECKGTGFPEIPWSRHVYHAGFRIRSFSKYGECINQALHGGAPTVVRMSI